MSTAQVIQAQAAAIEGRDIYELFSAHLDATDKTRRTYAAALKSWRRYLDDAGLGELEATNETVIAYREALKATRSAATVNAYMTALRAFYAWLEAKRICPNIAAGVRGVRTSNTSSKDALTVEQARALLAAQAATEAELRDRAMLALMTLRGLRTIEIVRANVGDVRQLSGVAVLYVQGKGYADRSDFVVLGDACLSAIYSYLEVRGEVGLDAPLFASVSPRNPGGRMTTRSVSRIAKNALGAQGLTSARLTAHSLRHTAVTLALLGGATVQEAQAMARHKDISTTQIYAHNIERLTAAAEKSIDAYVFG